MNTNYDTRYLNRHQADFFEALLHWFMGDPLINVPFNGKIHYEPIEDEL